MPYGEAIGAQLEDAWRMKSFVVIDFETTGFSPDKERIVEMGLAIFEHGQFAGSKNWLTHPGKPIPEEASNVHGIYDADVASAPKFSEVFADARQYMSQRLPVAYNAEFDRSFLVASYCRLGGSVDEDPPIALNKHVIWLDPLIWVREFQKYEKGKKLTDACRRLGIPVNDAHCASADAEMTGEVLLKLARRMPKTYREVIAKQKAYDKAQQASYAIWRKRQELIRAKTTRKEVR